MDKLLSLLKSFDASLDQRIGLSYAAFYGHSFESFISIAATLGFRHVQLTPDQSPNLFSEFDEKRTKELLAQSKRLGIELHVHNVFYDINIVSVVPEIQDFALSVTAQVADLASALHAQTFTIHPGYRFPGWRRIEQEERFWSAAQRGLTLLSGISTRTNMKFLLENGSYYVTTSAGNTRTPLHVGIDPKEMALLCDMTGGQIGVSLDLNKVRASENKLGDFADALGSHIKQFQISSMPTAYSAQLELKELLLAPEYRDAIIFYEGQITLTDS